MGAGPSGKQLFTYPRTYLLSTAQGCKDLLSSCKGRDKFLAVVQFLCAVYRECMKDYLESNRLQECPSTLNHAKTIQQSLKSSRKMFKLLKFISEITAFEETWKKCQEVRIIHVLKMSYNALSFFYYILDNLLWVRSIGVVGTSLKGDVQNWKAAKDIISMFRAGLKISIAIHQYTKAGTNLSDCISSLSSSSKIQLQSPAVSSLLKLRFKQRMRATEVFTNVFRLISLVKSLELPGHKRLSTIFVCLCRLMGAGLSLMKIYFLMLETEEK